MVSTRPHHRTGYRVSGLLAALLILLSVASAWPQGQSLQAEDPRQRRAAPGRAVIVQGGQLSVDLQGADLAEVLTEVGRQAGIRIAAGPSAGKRVSARFAEVGLEDGLRRLLRLASLNHIFLYAPGPAGTVAITELRVLGEGAAGSARPSAGDEPDSASQKEHWRARPEGPSGRDVPEPVPEVVEVTPERTREPVQREPTQAMRRVLDAFTRGKQMGERPPAGASPDSPAAPGYGVGDGEGEAR
jgi:hypothetical protein